MKEYSTTEVFYLIFPNGLFSMDYFPAAVLLAFGLFVCLVEIDDVPRTILVTCGVIGILEAFIPGFVYYVVESVKMLAYYVAAYWTRWLDPPVPWMFWKQGAEVCLTDGALVAGAQAGRNVTMDCEDHRRSYHRPPFTYVDCCPYREAGTARRCCVYMQDWLFVALSLVLVAPLVYVTLKAFYKWSKPHALRLARKLRLPQKMEAIKKALTREQHAPCCECCCKKEEGDAPTTKTAAAKSATVPSKTTSYPAAVPPSTSKPAVVPPKSSTTTTIVIPLTP